MNMEIAGVNFASDASIRLSGHRLPGTYRPFIKGTISQPGRTYKRQYQSTLIPSNIPDTRQRLTKIFDSRAIMVYVPNEMMIISYRSISQLVIQPGHLARNFQRSSAMTYTIYCSDLLMNKEDKPYKLLYSASYPLDQLLLMYILAKTVAHLLHAAGVSMNNKGYIFPAGQVQAKAPYHDSFLEGTQRRCSATIVL